MDLHALMQQCGTDKAGHRFDLPYGGLFAHRRDSVLKVLEIGVKSGGSLRLWEQYFPNAKIVGLDIDPACRAYASERSKVFIGDAYNPTFMRSVLAQVGGDFDLIVDDGSHISDDQVIALKLLWPALRAHGGIFAVEDTHAHIKYSKYKNKDGKYPTMAGMMLTRLRSRLRKDKAVEGAPGICVYGGIVLLIKNNETIPTFNDLSKQALAKLRKKKKV